MSHLCRQRAPLHLLKSKGKHTVSQIYRVRKDGFDHFGEVTADTEIQRILQTQVGISQR